MPPTARSLRRCALMLPAVVLMAALAGLLAYLAGQFGSTVVPPPPPATPALVTAAPPQTGAPEQPFARLDPAVVAYLGRGLPDYGAVALDISRPDLPPIGAFLPRTGNTRFALERAATPLPPPTAAPGIAPTLPPYPTSPPLPTVIIPTLPPGSPTPDLVATAAAFAASVPYGAFPFSLDNCAPAGRPVSGVLTQYFYGRHSGIDLAAPSGTPVQTTHSGIVTWAGWNTFGYGNLVIVQSGDFITYYAHLTSPNVNVGDFVARDAIVGWSGSTGNSSGPHVHYETRINDVPVDPLTFEERGYAVC